MEIDAIVAHAFGEPDSFAIERYNIPQPRAVEVRVRIHAAAVNFVDGLVASGRYQVKPDLPFVPGGEFAGIVESVGCAVTGLAAGDHVAGSGLNGSFAQAITLPAASVAPLPEGMDFVVGATFRVSHATAIAGLVQGAGVQQGETVLVLGAGGGVGLAAVGIAKALGACVIASASNAHKRALAVTAGAYASVATDAPNWREQLRAIAPGGVDVVVDPVGGMATEAAFRSLRWGGRHLVIGFAAGAIPALPTNLALVKGLRLIGVNIREFNLREPEEGANNMRRLNAMWEQGLLTPPPVTVFPFARFADAMRHAANRTSIGRTVLSINEYQGTMP